MSNTNGKKALHAFLSDDAHDEWHDFAAENGVSVSALLESFAYRILDYESNDTGLKEALTQAVRDARKLDAQRRRRTRS